MKKLVVFVFVILALVLASCGQPVSETAAPSGSNGQGAAQPTVDTGASEDPGSVAPDPSSPAGEPDVCASDAKGCAVVPAGQTIKIGMGGPMTGDYSSFGIDISQGATIAIENAEPVEGFSFELVAQDTQGGAEGGAAVANRFVTDPTMVAIAGHIFSGETEAAIPIYDGAGLPMLSPSATNPPLTELGSSVFNRIAFTDAVQGKGAAEYIYNELGVRKLAAMHDGTAYGLGLAEVVRDEFTALGGEVVAFEAITPGEADYTATLSAIAARGPELLYYGGYVGEAVVIQNQMAQSGLVDVILFGCDGTFGAEFIDKTGPNGEGAFATSVIPPESEAKVAFDAQYLDKFGVAAGQLSPFTWNGHDVTAALIEAVRQVAVLGGDGKLYVPRSALVDAVRGMEGFEGITGDITCDEKGECNTAGPTFYIVQDGDWVQAE